LVVDRSTLGIERPVTRKNIAAGKIDNIQHGQNIDHHAASSCRQVRLIGSLNPVICGGAAIWSPTEDRNYSEINDGDGFSRIVPDNWEKYTSTDIEWHGMGSTEPK